MNFWNTPLGDISRVLVHDHAGPSGSIKAGIRNIRTALDEKIIDKESILERLSRLEKNIIRCDNAVDAAYEKLKNFPQ